MPCTSTNSLPMPRPPRARHHRTRSGRRRGRGTLGVERNMMLNPHIFRAYDVRGRVGADLNPEIFRQVGRAYATLIRRNGGRTIAVGQDNRESSAGLNAGFVEGARAAGVNVVDVGVV